MERPTYILFVLRVVCARLWNWPKNLLWKRGGVESWCPVDDWVVGLDRTGVSVGVEVPLSPPRDKYFCFNWTSSQTVTRIRDETYIILPLRSCQSTRLLHFLPLVITPLASLSLCSASDFKLYFGVGWMQISFCSYSCLNLKYKSLKMQPWNFTHVSVKFRWI